MTAKELLEKAGKLGAEIRKMADTLTPENPDFIGEAKENWTRLNADYDATVAMAKNLERAETVAASLSAPSNAPVSRGAVDTGRPAVSEPTAEERDTAFKAWGMGRRFQDSITEQHAEAAKKCGVRIGTNEMTFRLDGDYNRVKREVRSQSVLNPTAGGYTVPNEFVRNLESAMLWYGGIAGAATVLRTAGNGDVTIPTSNDTSNTGAIIAENAQDTNQDVSFAAITMRAYKYTSKMIFVSRELMQDSAFNMSAFLAERLGERLGRIKNTDLTTGSGASKPTGVVTASTLGVTAASATAFTADEVLGLIHSVDPAYRQLGCSFMMNDAVLLMLRKLKDGNGQYLFNPTTSTGPANIWGFPYIVNNDMDAVPASGDKSILFGAFSKYLIREVAEVTVRRSEHFKFDYDQEAFVANIRFDGNLLDAGVAPVKHLVH